MNVYDIKKYNVILEILWLSIHNSEINWKTRKIKITQCFLICQKSLE